MKKITKLCCILFIFLIFGLTSCTKSVTGTLEIVAKRASIDVSVELFDDKDLVETVSCTIYTKGDDDTLEQVNTKKITLSSSKKGSDLFKSLNTDTLYVVKLFANYNGDKHELDMKEAKTSSTGVVDAPIEITSYTELLDIKNDNKGYYVLKNDIDCNGEDITPLFDSSTSFEGSFDGAGFKICNFNFYQNSTDSNKQYSGLFGVNKGTIKNLVIENVKLKSSRGGDTYVGVLCGRNYGDVEGVKAVNVEINVTSTSTGWQYVGGLIGYCDDKSSVDKCSVEGLKMELSLKNKAQIGGLVGTVSEPSIEKYASLVTNSYVSGSINGKVNATYSSDCSTYVGGFIGFNASEINDCYSDVSIDLESTKSSLSNAYSVYVGGFNAYSKMGIIKNCAAGGNISYKSSDVLEALVGGVCGYATTYSSISNTCYVGSEIKVSCGVSKYNTSTNSTDEKYVKFEDDTYKLMSELYYKDGETYKELITSKVSTTTTVYTKDGEAYNLYDKKISTSTTYKFIPASDAYASFGVAKVGGGSTAKVFSKNPNNITYLSECKYEIVDVDVVSEFEGFSELVLNYINK